MSTLIPHIAASYTVTLPELQEEKGELKEVVFGKSTQPDTTNGPELISFPSEDLGSFFL